MKVIHLEAEYLEAFIAYCKKHKMAHDESFLYDEELDAFAISDNDPTYLLVEDNQIIGCLSYMVDPYYLADDKTRIRIFHCERSLASHYKMLLDAAWPIGHGIKRMEMFIPEALNDTKKILESLGFDYYRTSYVMIRKDKPLLQVAFPEGYALKPFRKNQDEMTYAFIRNQAFKSLKGSEVPITEDMVIKQYESNELLKNGMQILWHLEKPVGVIRVIREEDECGDFSCIAPIALLPEYQSKGLGKILLSSGIEIGQENDLNDCLLVVNGENEKALSMYLKASFERDLAVSCFVRHLSGDENK